MTKAKYLCLSLRQAIVNRLHILISWMFFEWVVKISDFNRQQPSKCMRKSYLTLHSLSLIMQRRGVYHTPLYVSYDESGGAMLPLTLDDFKEARVDQDGRCLSSNGLRVLVLEGYTLCECKKQMT